VQLGQPEMLLDYPVYVTDAMDSVAANAFPVALKRWSPLRTRCVLLAFTTATT
jgi:HK97 family phage major capsid protein